MGLKTRAIPNKACGMIELRAKDGGMVPYIHKSIPAKPSPPPFGTTEVDGYGRCRSCVQDFARVLFRQFPWRANFRTLSASDMTLFVINTCKITVYNNSQVKSGSASRPQPERDRKMRQNRAETGLGTTNGSRVGQNLA